MTRRLKLFEPLVWVTLLICSCNDQAEEKAAEPQQNAAQQAAAGEPKPLEGPGQVQPASQEPDPNGSRELRGHEKRLLRLIYADEILQEVKIHVGQPQQLPSNPLWQLIVQIALQNDYGITVGSDIYFPSEPDTTTAWGLEWLSHEIRHVQQYQQAGSLENFIQAYSWYLMSGVISLDPAGAYLNNPFENDARVFEGCMSRLLLERPELLEVLQLDGKERETRLAQLLYGHIEDYKKIILAQLEQAQKMPTTFKTTEEQRFTIDFQLKGKFTKPVGGTINLLPDSAKLKPAPPTE